MYTKIGIPENNSLKSKIEELYEWCDKRDNDDELGKTYFNEPIDEDKLDYVLEYLICDQKYKNRVFKFEGVTFVFQTIGERYK